MKIHHDLCHPIEKIGFYQIFKIIFWNSSMKTIIKWFILFFNFSQSVKLFACQLCTESSLVQKNYRLILQTFLLGILDPLSPMIFVYPTPSFPLLTEYFYIFCLKYQNHPKCILKVIKENWIFVVPKIL